MTSTPTAERELSSRAPVTYHYAIADRGCTTAHGGTVTPVGNSKGIRLDAEFFKAHPEFNGKVDATVIADGQVLLSTKTSKQRKADDDEIDPVMLGFLSFLQKQVAEHPEMIEPADRAQLSRIRKLVKGVDVE
jgi:hypothetical protein